ncbi:hypothetical protein K503DRAFT_782109 [Rhizopogon vinicolor AM-OR11-026]|uniref:Uncharacterized protein n=1 Tax=Rhizopogon vinicolor AM-OR11-026 TaxID=1314800 RepID=A0A1B7N3P3_9AGAM|nr:hypothetical protein K503DRAFT_782109 [Rhizopogon vinicolor AM-OR11-026]
MPAGQEGDYVKHKQYNRTFTRDTLQADERTDSFVFISKRYPMTSLFEQLAGGTTRIPAVYNRIQAAAFMGKPLHQEPSLAVPPSPVPSNLSLPVCVSCEHAVLEPDDDTSSSSSQMPVGIASPR